MLIDIAWAGGSDRAQKQMCVVCCEIPSYSETAPDEKEKKIFSPLLRTYFSAKLRCVCVHERARDGIFFGRGHGRIPKLTMSEKNGSNSISNKN